MTQLKILRAATKQKKIFLIKKKKSFLISRRWLDDTETFRGSAPDPTPMIHTILIPIFHFPLKFLNSSNVTLNAKDMLINFLILVHNSKYY